MPATWQRPAEPRCCGCTGPCCGRASVSAATTTGASPARAGTRSEAGSGTGLASPREGVGVTGRWGWGSAGVVSVRQGPPEELVFGRCGGAVTCGERAAAQAEPCPGGGSESGSGPGLGRRGVSAAGPCAWPGLPQARGYRPSVW